jgi:hypothetical protein
VTQSIQRNIVVQELREAIDTAEIIEDYPNDKCGPSVLLLGFSLGNRPLHIQCSYPSRPLVKIIVYGGCKMTSDTRNESFEDQYVTYVLDLDGEIIIFEHVPARVNTETGERLFAPETVEKLQAIIRSRQAPKKMIQTPVFDFAA